jgi:hypothetical protein
MKTILYIDFDGVIKDTISIIYAEAERKNIDLKDPEICKEFFVNYDWHKLLKEAKVLEDSINNIKLLDESGLFKIMILTHVYSNKEAFAKYDDLAECLPNITMIPVPKSKKKTDMVNAKGCILVDDYKGNLKEWEEAGGIAYRFCVTETDDKFNSISSLRDLIYFNKEDSSIDYTVSLHGKK